MSEPPATAEEAERALALSYAEPRARAALTALLALDNALAKVLRTTREPALGQMRLAWWREALPKLDSAPPPAEPVLQGLARDVITAGVTGEMIVQIVHGWEVLIEEEQLDEDALHRFAKGRGALFTLAARAAGAADDVTAAGRGWALADLAAHLKDSAEAEQAQAMARELLDQALARRWSRKVRALGAMAHLARMDLSSGEQPLQPGAPRRVGRLLWHRLTGR